MLRLWFRVSCSLGKSMVESRIWSAFKHFYCAIKYLTVAVGEICCIRLASSLQKGDTVIRRHPMVLLSDANDLDSTEFKGLSYCCLQLRDKGIEDIAASFYSPSTVIKKASRCVMLSLKNRNTPGPMKTVPSGNRASMRSVKGPFRSVGPVSNM